MRPKTSIYIATTVDGFIARPDGAIDWLEHDAKGEDYGWAAFRESIDSLIIGRRTYEQVLSFEVPWPYHGLSTVIWSRTLGVGDLPEALSKEDVTVSQLPADALLETLGTRGLKHTWIDGGQTLQAFLSAGLIEQMTLTRLPTLIGQGRALFGPLTADLHLSHVDTTSFSSGVVQSTYAVTP
jgi:dihydrofolate reductase